MSNELKISKMKVSSKEKYDVAMMVINSFTLEERCNIIMDMIEDIELVHGEELKRPDVYIRMKAHKVLFEK
jgi:hypothetical protein